MYIESSIQKLQTNLPLGPGGLKRAQSGVNIFLVITSPAQKFVGGKTDKISPDHALQTLKKIGKCDISIFLEKQPRQAAFFVTASFFGITKIETENYIIYRFTRKEKI